MTILPYSYDPTMSNFLYLYDNIVILICQLHLVRHRVHYYSYDPVTISIGRTTTTDTPCSGAVMTAAQRCVCGWVYGGLCDCRNCIQKSSSNSLHHSTLSRVHTSCFCCRMRTTLYTMVCRPQEFLINILVFELKAVGKIFSKRTKIFFVDCQILENVYICQNLSKIYNFGF